MEGIAECGEDVTRPEQCTRRSRTNGDKVRAKGEILLFDLGIIDESIVETRALGGELG